jgi:hypothetical protein
VIEKELGLNPDMLVLAGVAVGFEDETHRLNHIKTDRDAYKKSVEFVED